jgi:HPt (histidine-containing phosphotransfer) domain-containing protein
LDAAPPPVDLEEFRSVMREAGVESVVPLTLRTFMGEAPRLREAIRSAAAPENGDDGVPLASAAHAYKSSAGNVRAKTLYAVLGELEAQARTGGIHSALPLLERMEEAHEAVMDYLSQQEDVNA